jgi:prophage antirepressor-like protein
MDAEETLSQDREANNSSSRRSQTDRLSGRTHEFDFGDHRVRVLIDDTGAPIWVAKDVCDALNLSRTDSALRRIPDGEKGTQTLSTPGGPQEVSVITEPGLYRLIFRSTKDEAEKFQDWVFGKVLPEIRKTGRYAPDTPPDAVAENHEHRLTRMEREIEALRDEGAPTAEVVAALATAVARELDDRGATESAQTHWRLAWWTAITKSKRLSHDEKQKMLSIWPLLESDEPAQLPDIEDGRTLQLLEDATDAA